jgi:hypothetical protein
LNGYPKKPKNDAFFQQFGLGNRVVEQTQTGGPAPLRVTYEQFGDTLKAGCPETTLFSVTDNGHTDRDTRRSADAKTPQNGAS